MSTQKLLQKNSTSTNTATLNNQFEGRGFAVQQKSMEEEKDLKSQLKQAKRFGHSISQMKSESAPSSKQDQTSQNSSGSRSSMPAPVRSKMENSFGTSFSDVNIHADSPQATSIGALAFTQGSNVHFAPGQYNPQSSSGQALLGHELTHVVQQRSGRVSVPSQSKGAPINADPSLETEADQIGAKAAQGQQVQVPGATSNFKTIPPVGSIPAVQNSTKPVQCFLPMLMGGLNALGAVGGMMGGGGQQQGGGGAGGMMSGIGGALGGMFGPLGGMAGSMLGGVADSFMGG
jgi:Domain of unknown function (DUF4157)